MRQAVSRAPKLFELVAAAVAAGYTAAVVAFVARRCYFYGDDFLGFELARARSFWDGLGVPFGGQLAPLARALNYVFFRVFGMNYGAAIAVLCAFHATGMVYLYRTLDHLKRTPVNAALIALYASNVYTWPELGWWSAGLERVPFVAFGAMSLYYYTRYGETRRRRDLVATCVCDAVALGFYGKGLLLPLYMIGLDVARSRIRETKPWIVAAALFVVGLAVEGLGYRAVEGPGIAVGGTPLSSLVRYVGLSLVVFAHGAAGVALDYAPYSPSPAVGALWLLLVVYTLVRAPRVWLAWLVLLAALLANLLLVGATNRIGLFGPLMAFEIRYYWELAFFTVLVLGVILHRTPLPDFPGAQIAAALLLVACALVSHWSFTSTAFAHSEGLPRTRAFVDNLRADLARLGGDGPVTLADGPLPVFVSGFDFSFRTRSQLLSLMDAPVQFAPQRNATHRITDDGHVVPVARPDDLQRE